MSVFTSHRKIFGAIFFSHLLSAWGDRMWDFAVGLYMITLYPESFLVTAILGFVTSLSVIAFGSTLGTWIDRTNRLTSASISIIVQNVTIAITGCGIALTFFYVDEMKTMWNGMLLSTVFALIILASAIAKLASVASDIAIERDWVVVLTEGDDTSLARMNSVMRTIDLTTKILAPVAIGVLISYWSQMASAVFVAGWNAVSCILEVYLLVFIYKSVPNLRDKVTPSTKSEASTLKEYWEGWKEYFNHPVKLAGIAFSFLFMTALGFDQITIGYLYQQGVSESFIGILTAFAAITGIIGSVAYPCLRSCLRKNATAILGYILNTVCLFLCVLSIFMPGSPFEPSAILNVPTSNTTTATIETSTAFTIQQLWQQRRHIFVFIAGVVLARFGLWVADLSTCQLLQDTVHESKRGVINGVQNSMNQFMDMLKFLLVIALPSPLTFGYLVIATWIFSCGSCALYSAFAIIERNARDKETDAAVSNLSEEKTPLLQK